MPWADPACAAARESRRRASAKWRAANPERVAAASSARRLMKKYGITPAQRDEFLADQGGCGICGGDASADPHMDHDHESGQLRSVLCEPCNLGLGHFKDDPVRLELAAAYLRGWRAWT